MSIVLLSLHLTPSNFFRLRKKKIIIRRNKKHSIFVCVFWIIITISPFYLFLFHLTSILLHPVDEEMEREGKRRRERDREGNNNKQGKIGRLELLREGGKGMENGEEKSHYYYIVISIYILYSSMIKLFWRLENCWNMLINENGIKRKGEGERERASLLSNINNIHQVREK